MRALSLGSEGKRKGRRWGAGETLTLQQRKTSLGNSGPRERQGLKCKRSTGGRSRTGSAPAYSSRGVVMVRPTRYGLHRVGRLKSRT